MKSERTEVHFTREERLASEERKAESLRRKLAEDCLRSYDDLFFKARRQRRERAFTALVLLTSGILGTIAVLSYLSVYN